MVSVDSARALLERILRDAKEEPIALPLSFLKSITNNFSDDQKIGSGGFATVYKGLLTNGTVAVKKLSQTLEVHEKGFNQEVDSLMRVKHKNIVRFLGYCADTQGKIWKYEGKNVMAEDRQRLLCFEFMPNGSLDKYISDGSGGLEWMTRYQIIRGICDGLNYLHQQKIVHLDLKPANILLDYCMVPKISDFGVSKCFDEKQTRAITSKCIGSQGYMAPEYFNGDITLKSDIYSLGVIIMEIITGQKGYPDINNVLDSWSSRLRISRVDKRLEYVSVCLRIGIDCIDPNPAMRPATWRIIEILLEMERSHGFIETECSTSLAPHCLFRSMEAAAGCVPCDIEQGATHHGPIEKAAQEIEDDLDNKEMKINNPISVFEKAAHEFNADMDMVKMKIHRYPAMIRVLGDYYTTPTMLAIGPYHHGREHLKAAEKLKHVAAYHCINQSGHTADDIYDAVVSAANDARIRYDKYAMTGISDDDFFHMMFYDACFLVQYMISFIHNGSAEMEMDSSLGTFLASNRDEIFHDIMLLENQIPWHVVEVIMRFRPVPLEVLFASWKGCLQHRNVPDENPVFLYDSYEPPHLLGLFRFYVVGRRNGNLKPLEETRKIPFSASAMELDEMGIRLTGNKTTELIHMGIRTGGTMFGELSLAPLSLNDMRGNCLVNMAALELCTTLNFTVSEDEDSAVCSYLLLFAKLVDREEDVHRLREKHLLQGGGLTNSEALKFFMTLQALRLGSCYVRIMEEIEDYMTKRRIMIKVHAFIYRNYKTIVAACSAFGALVGIMGTLKSVKVK